jgi:hypothetical protein
MYLLIKKKTKMYGVQLKEKLHFYAKVGEIG